MEVISGTMSSDLNPYAAPYVPGAYKAVEDFSEEWWALVDSSPYFRDYWLRECFEDPENDPDLLDIYDPAFSDTDSLFHSYPDHKEVVDKIGKELVGFGSEKWMVTRGGSTDRVKWFEKAPKIVSVKLSPRTIQQPR